MPSSTENVATAKNEAISAAATDAQKKADAALASAKEHAAGLNTAMDTRVKAVRSADLADHCSPKLKFDLG